MTDRENVIVGLTDSIEILSDFDTQEYTIRERQQLHGSVIAAIQDALTLLKAQEQATIEPKRIDLADETKAWLDKMDAVDALGNIADICMDWDGYRTADGLGGLINEIWAYARYCADRLRKAQEPVKPYAVYSEHTGTKWLVCGACDEPMNKVRDETWSNYCPNCGRAVKWE